MSKKLYMSLIFSNLVVIKTLSSMGHRTKRILRIERKEYQTY